MRMNQTSHKTGLSIFFAVLCAVAIFAGIWGFLTGNGAIPALVAAVLLLVAAQLLLFFIMTDRQDIDRENDDNSIDGFEQINSRLAGLEQQIKQLSRLKVVENPVAQVKQIAKVEPELPAPSLKPTAAAAPKTEQVHIEAAYLDDTRLSLYLEPVVDLSSLKTAFYRAELAFEAGPAQRVRITDMAEKIAEGGHSAAVDMKLFNRLGPVIDRLKQKGQLAGVICPMSQHSFSNQLFLEELTRYLKHYPELARVLIIEISQANLAGLDQDGMAGLAFLAQIGATFSLGGAGLESPDLGSLASLGFRYLDLDYADNIGRYSLQAFASSGPAAQLRDLALGVGIQLIGSGLARKSQHDALNHIISFGRGTAFSAARLVRTDFARQTTQTKAA